MLGRERTKDVARSRLSSVLREDRPTVTARDLALMQLDVLAALSGYLEMSNVDLATEMSYMITTQRGYQANTRMITVSDEMLEELVNMKR